MRSDEERNDVDVLLDDTGLLQGIQSLGSGGTRANNRIQDENATSRNVGSQASVQDTLLLTGKVQILKFVTGMK